MTFAYLSVFLFILQSYLHILQETPAVLLPLVNNITRTDDNIFY